MIVTPRLHLRRARIEDVADLHRVFADPRAMRYWDSLPHAGIDATRAWLARMVAFSPAETDDFIVQFQGRAIGKAGCWRLGEIGFILHSDHWGQGLATEALTAIIPHVFASLPIARLEADVDPRNDAALALLEVRVSRDRAGRADGASGRRMVRQRLSGAAAALTLRRGAAGGRSGRSRRRGR